MRRLLTMLAFLPAAFRVAPAVADTIVLKDGQTIESSGPYMVKGRQALLKKSDGTLVSIPVSEIDVDKTAAARRKLETLSPTPTPLVRKPLTPAEAAKQSGGRKAVLVLTDEEVAQSIGLPEGSDKKDEAGARVEVSNMSGSKVTGGYAITGSVLNSGKADAAAVSVTIELVGENNKTIASGFGQIAKDTLSPGEKSSFTATIETDREATNFRCVPRWQAKAEVKSAASGGGAGTAGRGDTTAEPTPAAEASQSGQKGEKEKSAPAPPPTPIPRPDVAPRAPNAPVGAPEKPGGTFLPQPSGQQAKPPSGL
jgi:hypothetical protein